MTVSRALTDLGLIEGAGGRGAGGCKLLHGVYTAEGGDTYQTEDKCLIAFNRISKIEQILGLYSDSVGYLPMLCLRPPVKGAVAYDLSGPTFTDETAEANEATANDMHLLPAVGEPIQVNDAYYFGGLYQFDYLLLNIGTAGAGVWTITWEYYNGSAWVALTGVTDNTTHFRAAPGEHTVVFTKPTDWATVAVSGITAYWIRGRVSAYVSATVQPLGTQAWAMGNVPRNVIIASLYWGGGAGAVFREVADTTVIGAVNIHAVVVGN